jgi:Flp pilus assembly protein TadG
MKSMMAFSMPRILGRFARDKRGVSAIEFAFLAPLMIALYLGCVEISDGVAADRKVTLTAGTLANLLAQSTGTLQAADFTNIFNASTAVMKPYSTATLAATVSCLKIDAAGVVKVAWSETKNGTARAIGSSPTIPAALVNPSTSLIWSEVTFGYTPIIGYTITGTLNLSDQMFMSPRQTAPADDINTCS